MPLLRSLEVLREQTPHKNLAIVLDDVHSRVQEGATLADAMARHPRAFGELATSIVRAGGEGGFLEEALERLAKFTEQQDELKSRVIGALAYPTILFVLGTIVVNVLIIFFVPKFEALFQPTCANAASCRPSPIGCLWLSHIDADVRHLHRRWRCRALAWSSATSCRPRKAACGSTAGGSRCRWRAAIYLSLAVSRFCRVLGTLLTAACRSCGRWRSAPTRPATACCPRRSARRPKTFPPASRWPRRSPPAAISRPTWWK